MDQNAILLALKIKQRVGKKVVLKAVGWPARRFRPAVQTFKVH